MHTKYLHSYISTFLLSLLPMRLINVCQLQDKKKQYVNKIEIEVSKYFN